MVHRLARSGASPQLRHGGLPALGVWSQAVAGAVLGALRLSCQAGHQPARARLTQTAQRNGSAVTRRAPLPCIGQCVLWRGSACQPCKWLVRPPRWQALCRGLGTHVPAWWGGTCPSATLGGSGNTRQSSSNAQSPCAHREGTASACVGGRERRDCEGLRSPQCCKERLAQGHTHPAAAHCAPPEPSTLLLALLLVPLHHPTLISCRPHRTPPGSPSRLAAQQQRQLWMHRRRPRRPPPPRCSVRAPLERQLGAVTSQHVLEAQA